MGKRKDGITSITRLKRRCSIARMEDPECCWLWKGATYRGKAAVWVVIDGKGKLMTAPRAAAELSGKQVPPGGNAWASCNNPMCGNPRHAVTGTRHEWGAWIRQHELWCGNERLIAAMRANGRKSSKIDLELAREIRASALPPSAEARRIKQEHGVEVSRTLVYDVRLGRRWAEPSLFAGLGAR